MEKCDTCQEEKFMTKEEFIDKVNERLIAEGNPALKPDDLSDEDFSVINTVYAFHPAIDDVFGKDQITDLYVNYGFSVIMDMLVRAERMQKLEKQLKNMKSALGDLQDEIYFVRKGQRITMF